MVNNMVINIGNAKPLKPCNKAANATMANKAQDNTSIPILILYHCSLAKMHGTDQFTGRL